MFGLRLFLGFMGMRSQCPCFPTPYDLYVPYDPQANFFCFLLHIFYFCPVQMSPCCWRSPTLNVLTTWVMFLLLYPFKDIAVICTVLSSVFVPNWILEKKWQKPHQFHSNGSCKGHGIDMLLQLGLFVLPVFLEILWDATQSLGENSTTLSAEKKMAFKNS